MEAIAAGDGREVMQFDEEGLACACCLGFVYPTVSTVSVFDNGRGFNCCEEGQIMNVADGSCLTLVDGDTCSLCWGSWRACSILSFVVASEVARLQWMRAAAPLLQEMDVVFLPPVLMGS